MSALMELRGLSLMTMKICSSFSRFMKLPNHDFLASLFNSKTGRKQVIMYLLIEYFLTQMILPLQLNVEINIRPQRKSAKAMQTKKRLPDSGR